MTFITPEPYVGHLGLDGVGEFGSTRLERAEFRDLARFGAALGRKADGIRHGRMMAQLGVTFDRRRGADGNVCS